MGNINKSALLLLISLIVISIVVTAKPVTAQPSIPEFALRYVSHPYDVPPSTTSTTDPYTGNTITTTTPGYHVENKTFDIIIKNQPFASQEDDSGNYTSLLFDLRIKPHYTQYWKYYYGYSPSDSFSTQNYVKADPSQSSTIVSFQVTESGFLKFKGESITFPQGGYVDVQVKALIASETTSVLYGNTVYHYRIDSESDWSASQTLEIGEASTSTPNSTYPTTTLTPTSPSSSLDINSDSTDLITLPLTTFTAIIVIITVIAFLALAISIVALRRQGKTSNQKQ